MASCCDCLPLASQRWVLPAPHGNAIPRNTCCGPHHPNTQVKADCTSSSQQQPPADTLTCMQAGSSDPLTAGSCTVAGASTILLDQQRQHSLLLPPGGGDGRPQPLLLRGPLLPVLQRALHRLLPQPELHRHPAGGCAADQRSVSAVPGGVVGSTRARVSVPIPDTPEAVPPASPTCAPIPCLPCHSCRSGALLRLEDSSQLLGMPYYLGCT